MNDDDGSVLNPQEATTVSLSTPRAAQDLLRSEASYIWLRTRSTNLSEGNRTR